MSCGGFTGNISLHRVRRARSSIGNYNVQQLCWRWASTCYDWADKNGKPGGKLETFKKRQKAWARREKQQKKAARRMERRQEKAQSADKLGNNNQAVAGATGQTQTQWNFPRLGARKLPSRTKVSLAAAERGRSWRPPIAYPGIASTVDRIIPLRAARLLMRARSYRVLSDHALMHRRARGRRPGSQTSLRHELRRRHCAESFPVLHSLPLPISAGCL